MAAGTSVEDILAIDSSLIPPGFTHGLQIAIPQSPPQLENTFQQQPEKSQPRPLQQQQKFSQQPRPPPPPPYQRPQPRQQPQQSQQQRPQQKPQPIPLQRPQQSEQLQVQQQANLPHKEQRSSESGARRKGNSFCSWVRKKLWCIRSNSPMEPSLNDEAAEGILKEGTSSQMVTGEGSHATNVDLKKSVHNPNDRAGQMSTVGRSESFDEKSQKSESEVGKTKPKDRQVTFSDTVRTHIKTKYVTAEEYKQIRGMNATTGRIMYQIVKSRDGDDHPKDKVNPFAGNATRCKRRKPI